MCTARPIDLAICDVLMPGRDGLWLAEQLRQTSPDTMVVFGTAVEDLPPANTLRPGVAGYIVKPFRRTQVCAAVERAFDSRPAVTPARPALRLVQRPGDTRFE